MLPIKQHILNVYGREPETLDELACCTIAMINNTQNNGHSQRSKGRSDNHKVVGFDWDIKYSPEVSNTHSSPEGYPQNFMCKDHLPTGYPGWAGRVWIRYATECKGFGSDGFHKTLTHTGTGGFGTYSGPWEGVSTAHYHHAEHNPKTSYPRRVCYSWDFRIYSADWPAIATLVREQQTWAILSGKAWDPGHRFSWTDAGTLIEDSKLIAECATIRAKKPAGVK
jgi:hypothetical protein